MAHMTHTLGKQTTPSNALTTIAFATHQGYANGKKRVPWEEALVTSQSALDKTQPRAEEANEKAARARALVQHWAPKPPAPPPAGGEDNARIGKKHGEANDEPKSTHGSTTQTRTGRTQQIEQATTREECDFVVGNWQGSTCHSTARTHRDKTWDTEASNSKGEKEVHKLLAALLLHLQGHTALAA
ncbi:hypothetical protein TRVL_04150 [Trypanosoma vivax]|nr:hypothetical protein TRVL_04150 [Trypanosoma vivax]